MLEILGRPGVWRFAGFDRILAGLDLNEAIASLPEIHDRDLARRFFRAAEAAFMNAYLSKQGNT